MELVAPAVALARSSSPPRVHHIEPQLGPRPRVVDPSIAGAGVSVLCTMAALAGSVLPVYPHACGRMVLGGVGAWSSEHGILLHPCRPSVKMLCCCDGAVGGSGRRMGAGCDDGAGCSGGKAAGGNCCGVGEGWVCQVSSQTL